VTAIIGEGGSGGALGMAVADRVLILENAVYSVAAPEACASIVWRDASRKCEAAEQLNLTADCLLECGTVDEVVAEPPGGAHADHDEAAWLLDAALYRHVLALLHEDRDLMLKARHARYRAAIR
jgi:acetyl-CoA carboxylase carboxyl transferase subunit alpha